MPAWRPNDDGAVEPIPGAIRHSAATMRQLGVAPFCSACARTEPGSCCAAHVEEWHDPMLLFMNCLLGCDLRESRRQSADCLSQGPQGCQLIARRSSCVNFLCPSLTAFLGQCRSQALLSCLRQRTASRLESGTGHSSLVPGKASGPGFLVLKGRVPNIAVCMRSAGSASWVWRVFWRRNAPRAGDGLRFAAPTLATFLHS
jgi:hypothetical protein